MTKNESPPGFTTPRAHKQTTQKNPWQCRGAVTKKKKLKKARASDTMKITTAVSGLFIIAHNVLSAHGIRILQTNDDGWVELYTRVLNDKLREKDHDVVLSAPAGDRSHGKFYDYPMDGPTNRNASRPDLNWVNGHPVHGVRYGVEFTGPEHWMGQRPDLVVTGPNRGHSIWPWHFHIPHVVAAAYASSAHAVPAISFSVPARRQAMWLWNETAPPVSASVYAELAATLIDHLAESAGDGKPLLPWQTYLNVNFPVRTEACEKASDFKWFFAGASPPDFPPRAAEVKWCGNTAWQPEYEVLGYREECRISVAISDGADMTDRNDRETRSDLVTRLAKLIKCDRDGH
ncbi:PQ loop repeat protein [Purpureocillium lavendulum]|uniref:PQ loop repeat protein n=1 Tax=Purpureocillium lavendulum TaxID=1247861 RepID=A0AB34G8X0_9HYPO|nr:PQ loop repeat protein [Purpureocillium lavendulum]